MSSDELFSRERLAGYDPELMAKSVVLIVGAGALGQNTAQNLALAGVGEIRIADKDEFENHNRTRSPVYPLPHEQEQIGISKARVVAYKLRRLMTATRPSFYYASAWIQELGDGAFKDVAVVISCVDTPRARGYLSDKTRLHGIPFIEGGFDAADISLSCYPAARGEAAKTTPCWQCGHQDLAGAFSCQFYAARLEQIGFIPAIQNAAAILAGLQSEAAILALHGQMPLESCAIDFNIRTGKTRIIHLSTDPRCPGIHRNLEAEPIKLQTGADNNVEQLLQEISGYFECKPMIRFPHPVVWTAACKDCGRVASVQCPDWLWIVKPLCQSCGGYFPRLESEKNFDSPRIYSQLCLSSNPELLAATCRQVGLPPLTLVEAFTEQGDLKYFELRGSIQHLFNQDAFYG